MYCFQRKDGMIRKNYKEVVEYILTARIKNHEIMTGRYNKITDTYKCYTTEHKKILEPKRSLFQAKINNICTEFCCSARIWYGGCQEISIELHGDNVAFMLNELKNIK